MKVSELQIIIWLIVVCDAQAEEHCAKSDKNCVRNSSYVDNRSEWKQLTFHETYTCLPNWHMIFPGTKWCGVGNIADDDDDLGFFADVDRCCRAHDKCSDNILAGETKYNLTNTSPFTRLTCKCDEKFGKCLGDVDSLISLKIGVIYFNILGAVCFRKTYPAKCEKFSYVPVKKCVRYKYNKSKPKRYQWFDTLQFPA